MDRRLILYILGIALLSFLGLLLLMPPPPDDGQIRLPWQVARNADGRIQVFGFVLGATTLAEVRAVFGEDGKLSLFQTPDGQAPDSPEPHGVEAYFDQIHLQRLRADFVIALEVDQPTLAAMYERGLRISQTGSGSRRVTLTPEDAAALAGRPIRSIGYLPKARLDPELIERRFGVPAERRVETDSGVVHWLYPERGIDLARAPDGTLVIQYANAEDFARLLRPLAPLSAASP